jgi:hypothetical protein
MNHQYKEAGPGQPGGSTPLWFLAGLWFGSTAAGQGLVMFIGIVAIVGVFIIGTIFSAFATLVMLHWRMLLILTGAALLIAWMAVLYIREERSKVA